MENNEVAIVVTQDGRINFTGVYVEIGVMLDVGAALISLARKQKVTPFVPPAAAHEESDD